jgi:hypothetical protein
MRLPCEDCDYVADGPEGGQGNVRWRMAVHRRKHRQPGDRPSGMEGRVRRLEGLIGDLLDHAGLEEVE